MEAVGHSRLNVECFLGFRGSMRAYQGDFSPHSPPTLGIPDVGFAIRQDTPLTECGQSTEEDETYPPLALSPTWDFAGWFGLFRRAENVADKLRLFRESQQTLRILVIAGIGPKPQAAVGGQRYDAVLNSDHGNPIMVDAQPRR